MNKTKLLVSTVTIILLANILLNTNKATTTEDATQPTDSPISTTAKETFLKTNTTILTSSPTSGIKDQLPSKPVLFNESFEDGVRAFSNSPKRYHSSLKDIEGLDPHTKKLLQDNEYATVTTMAISELSHPQSHLHIEFIKLVCNKASQEQSFIQAPHLAQPNKSPSFITEKDRDFHRGVEEGKRQYEEKFNYQCQIASDLLFGLEQVIDEHYEQAYQASSFGEYWSQFSNEKEAYENFSKLTGIKKSRAILMQEAHRKSLRSKNPQEITASFIQVLDAVKQDPSLYINANVCANENRCIEHVGEKDYESYIANGAFLGGSGTFYSHMESLTKKKQTIGKLAWLKYKKKLNRNGCESHHIIHQDINLSRSIINIEKSLKPAQVQAADDKFLELMETHFANAQSILEC